MLLSSFHTVEAGTRIAILPFARCACRFSVQIGRIPLCAARADTTAAVCPPKAVTRDAWIETYAGRQREGHGKGSVSGDDTNLGHVGPREDIRHGMP